MCRLMRYYGGFSPTLVVKGGLDQHIRLLESILPSWVNPFTRGEDESVSGMVVGMVHLACRVDMSRLDSRVLQMVSEPTFVATGACRSGAWTWGSLLM